jgi:hypothetical protein
MNVGDNLSLTCLPRARWQPGPAYPYERTANPNGYRRHARFNWSSRYRRRAGPLAALRALS